MRRRRSGHGDGARAAVLTGQPAQPAQPDQPPQSPRPEARVVVLVSGRVQGVGLRAWVRSRARAETLVGSAYNLSDGRVEVVAEGTTHGCAALVSALGAQAPGRVSGLEVRWETPTGDLRTFSVG